MRVRLVQIDGKLPNLALMNLSHYHKSIEDEVELTNKVSRDLLTSEADRTYASTIFSFSKPKLDRFRAEMDGSTGETYIGGTGSGDWHTVEDVIGKTHEGYDYSVYPDFKDSIGFTMRGCRLRCGFCVVPQKEGRPKPSMTVNQIWRGDPYPKNVILLDNDFFGQPKEIWQERVKELKDGDFKVSFNQGLNVRLIHEEGARALSTLRYYDDQFKVRRLYTAWDNMKDEGIFFRGIKMLTDAGITPRRIMVYMLVGYDPEETMERIMYRFEKMKAAGLKVYPMVYNNASKDLKWFQRWVVMRYHQVVPWKDFTKDAYNKWRRDKRAEKKALNAK